jgi:hypothetical protein
LTIVLISLIIVWIGGWVGVYLFKKTESGPTSLADAKSNGNVRVVSNDVLFVNESNEEEVLMEIGKMHEYMNQLLGWGAWQSFDPKNKEDELQMRLKHIRTIIVPETRGPLKSDLERAADGIETALEMNESDKLLITHRIFHDLDVVMNDIVVDVYWGVTKTYGK